MLYLTPDMGIRKQDGFTIIETTLFLAVTGLLILAMVGGVAGSLNIQRYRDSVESFKSVIQEQYSALSSVQNGRSGDWSCDATSTISNEFGGEMRGQSDCLLVGKYMRIESGAISIYPVLAYENNSGQIDDIQSMRQDYVINASTTQVEERRLEWGAQIAWAKEGLDDAAATTPRNLGILFIRSPSSGRVFTFTSNAIPAKDAFSSEVFRDMIIAGDANEGEGQTERMICIESGSVFVGGNMGVYIGPYASSASAVEVRTNDNPLSRDRDEGAIEC